MSCYENILKVHQCHILIHCDLQWVPFVKCYLVKWRSSYGGEPKRETIQGLANWNKTGAGQSLFNQRGHNPKQSKPHFRTKEAAAFLLKLISARTPSYRCCCCHHFLLSLHIMVVNMKAGTELTLWICIAIYRYVMSDDYLMIPSFSSKSLLTTKFSWSVQPINQATSELKQDSLKHLETKRAAVVWACGNCNLASHVG